MFRFPRTNFHELNLDWILNKVKELDKKVQHLIDSGGGGGVTSVNGATGDVVIPIPRAFNGIPAGLGNANPGVSEDFARGDHVHPLPSASDIGAEPAITEVVVTETGDVTQNLDAGKIYHFTGALTLLTITLNAPANGQCPAYCFDFLSGSTVPTLTMPDTVTMPDGWIIEPSARYEIKIINGYAKATKWADDHSRFIYLDATYGDFTLNNSGFSDGTAHANVGTEVIAISITGKLRSQLANNSRLKFCDISTSAKALMGSTYISSIIPVSGGKVAECSFNTWANSSEITIANYTGSSLPANMGFSGTIFILRTL